MGLPRPDGVVLVSLTGRRLVVRVDDAERIVGDHLAAPAPPAGRPVGTVDTLEDLSGLVTDQISPEWVHEDHLLGDLRAEIERSERLA
jgi:hypothetical protein